MTEQDLIRRAEASLVRYWNLGRRDDDPDMWRMISNWTYGMTALFEPGLFYSDVLDVSRLAMDRAEMARIRRGAA